MILAILQARFSSSRLPGKVLRPILGKPMLLHQIERIQRSKMIDKLVVATSVDDSDDSIEKMCLNNNIEVFRGDLNNVLDRYYQCAIGYNPNHIVRLTGDCPLADWQIIDKTIQHCLDGDFDYVVTDSNYPDGLGAEIMTMSALEEAYQHALLPSEAEHVTQYISKRAGQFKNGISKFNQNLSHLRLTVDELEDLVLVEKVFQSLYKNNPLFLIEDVLELLKRQSELTQINNQFIRDEGLLKSLKTDKEFLKNV
jgi:spore coat polysaccharide biosynthesis protein SpsF